MSFQSSVPLRVGLFILSQALWRLQVVEEGEDQLRGPRGQDTGPQQVRDTL